MPPNISATKKRAADHRRRLELIRCPMPEETAEWMARCEQTDKDRVLQVQDRTVRDDLAAKSAQIRATSISKLTPEERADLGL